MGTISTGCGIRFSKLLKLTKPSKFITDTITKPFNPERLLAAIRKIFAKQDAHAKKRAVEEKMPPN